MAKRPGTGDGMLASPTIGRNFAADLNAEKNPNADSCCDGAEDVSLEQILNLYSQPINEEQAWAVCYQCCRSLAQKPWRRGQKPAGASAARRIEGPGNVSIARDGTVRLRFEGDTGNEPGATQTGSISCDRTFSGGCSSPDPWPATGASLRRRGHVVVVAASLPTCWLDL